MGQKDIAEKIFEDYNDVFSDIFNGIVYGGEQVIKPEELSNALVHSQYKDEKGVLHEEERDAAKIWERKKVRLAVYGIENQSRIDRNLPLRVIGYDGANYKEMYVRAEKEKKKPVPAITLVLYFGNERWDRNRRISEIVNIPDGLEEYFNDYRINVVEVAWLEKEVIERFKSDFRVLAEFFVKRRENPNYRPDSLETIKHVDAMLKLLTVMTGDERYQAITKRKDIREVHTMCDVAERLTKEGEARGEARGICIGEARGEEKISKLTRLLIKEGKISDLEKAAEDSEYRKKLYILYGIEQNGNK